jgi:hypothetical protein
VDNFVETIIEVLRGDKTLRQEFGIEGRVAFYDRTNSSSLEDTLEQIHISDAPHPTTNTDRGRGRRKGRGKKGGGNKWHRVRRGLAREGDAIAALISSVFMSWLTSARYQFMR